LKRKRKISGSKVTSLFLYLLDGESSRADKSVTQMSRCEMSLRRHIKPFSMDSPQKQNEMHFAEIVARTCPLFL